MQDYGIRNRVQAALDILPGDAERVTVRPAAIGSMKA